MPRQAEKDGLQKHTLFLYEGDYARLSEMFAGVAPALIIRKIVRKFIKEQEAAPPNVKVTL